MIDSHVHLIDENPQEYADVLAERMGQYGMASAVIFATQGVDNTTEDDVREAVRRHPDKFIPFLSQDVDCARPDALSHCIKELESGFWRGIGEIFLDCSDDVTVRFLERNGNERVSTKPVPLEKEEDSLYRGRYHW